MTAPPPASTAPVPEGDRGTQWLGQDFVPGRVSVVMPTYNRAGLLANALDSLEGQTWRDGEIVVVDDGSTDDTLARLAARPPPPAGWTRVVVSQANAGVSAARNAGTRRCTGEFIVYLDSDDILHPPALERYVRTLRDSGADYCYAPIDKTDGAGRPLPDAGRFHPDPGVEDWELSCFWLVHGACYRRFVLAAAGPWNVTLTRLEDQEYLWRIKSLGFRAEHLPAVQGEYRFYGTAHLHLSFVRGLAGTEEWLGAFDVFVDWAEANGRLDHHRRMRFAAHYRSMAIRLMRAGSAEASGRAFDGMARMCRGTLSPLRLLGVLRWVKPGPLVLAAQQAWGRARIRLGW